MEETMKHTATKINAGYIYRNTFIYDNFDGNTKTLSWNIFTDNQWPRIIECKTLKEAKSIINKWNEL
jgi:hypothetical protein